LRVLILNCFRSVVLVLSLALAVPGFAQDQGNVADSLLSLSIEELLNVQVSTASRVGTSTLQEAPATIRIVTAEQIADRGYRSLLEVLADQPEIKVDFAVDPRWMNDITVRGVRYMDKVLFLLDGQRISSPTNELIPIMENYPVHLAQQIEIIFGPASALYGADAFSGVVNIITKKASVLTIQRLA